MLRVKDIILFSAVFSTAFANKVITVPASPSSDPSVVQYTGGALGLEAPRVQPTNDTSYEW
jgi:hypothetical protein